MGNLLVSTFGHLLLPLMKSALRNGSVLVPRLTPPSQELFLHSLEVTISVTLEVAIYSYANQWYTSDPLWDGEGCGGNSTCCEFNNLPWFYKDLPQPTTDDIELRPLYRNVYLLVKEVFASMKSFNKVIAQ